MVAPYESRDDHARVGIEAGMIAVDGAEDYIAVTLPLYARSTVAALTMAVLREADLQRRYRLSMSLFEACRAQMARPSMIMD